MPIWDWAKIHESCMSCRFHHTSLTLLFCITIFWLRYGYNESGNFKSITLYFHIKIRSTNEFSHKCLLLIWQNQIGHFAAHSSFSIPTIHLLLRTWKVFIFDRPLFSHFVKRNRLEIMQIILTEENYITLYLWTHFFALLLTQLSLWNPPIIKNVPS